jgi:hypothetical protein
MPGDDLRAHLQALYERHGMLTPQLVVEAARPKTSPLHAAVFDRGVREAAEAYYLDRARGLIRSYRLKYTRPDDTEGDVRAFTSVPTAGTPSRVYRATEEVAADPLLRAIALRDAERDWHTLKARYQHLGEFFAIVRADLDEAAA